MRRKAATVRGYGRGRLQRVLTTSPLEAGEGVVRRVFVLVETNDFRDRCECIPVVRDGARRRRGDGLAPDLQVRVEGAGAAVDEARHERRGKRLAAVLRPPSRAAPMCHRSAYRHHPPVGPAHHPSTNRHKHQSRPGSLSHRWRG